MPTCHTRKHAKSASEPTPEALRGPHQSTPHHDVCVGDQVDLLLESDGRKVYQRGFHAWQCIHALHQLVFVRHLAAHELVLDELHVRLPRDERDVDHVIRVLLVGGIRW